MPAAKGTQPKNAPKGRKKGVPNKLTATVKGAFEKVFHDLQEDPEKPHALAAWAQMEPTEFYKLAAKLIPTELKGELTHNHKVPGLAVVAAALGVKSRIDVLRHRVSMGILRAKLEGCTGM
jgi:hypothetical protein